MAKVTYVFPKGATLTGDINGKRVRYIFPEETEFNSFNEVTDYFHKNAKPYTCGSCQHHSDKNAGYCNYKGNDATIEDVHDRSEGRICSKFKKI